jgi:hypothetical protein
MRFQEVYEAWRERRLSQSGPTTNLEWLGNIQAYMRIAAPQMSHDLRFPPGSDN